MLGLLVLLLLAMQAAAVRGVAGDPVFGGGYRGMALVVATVFGLRLLSTLLFGAVLLGPVSALVSGVKEHRGTRSGTRTGTDSGTNPAPHADADPGAGPEADAGKSGDPARDGGTGSGTGSGVGKKILDRRWTLFGADALRVAALIIAPLWVDWTPGSAFAVVLITVFVTGVAERVSTVTRDSAAPALLPAAPPEGTALRPLPDHGEALRRLWLRSGFVALPVAAAAGLVVVTLLSNLLATGVDWFGSHQAALASYVAAGLFAAAAAVGYFLELPDGQTPRPRSPLEGLRRPRTADGGSDKGRTGAVPLLVVAGGAVGGAIASAVALAPLLQAADLGGGPVAFGLLALMLTGGTVAGIRLAPHTVPSLSRRRLLALVTGLTGLLLLVAGLVPDTATVIALALLAGLGGGIAANTLHTLLDQETEEARRARTTEHLQAVVRLSLAVGAIVAPVLAAFIGPHRVENGSFVFDHGGASFTLMLVGALLLPVGAILLGRTDDRQGVPLRRDLVAAFGGGRPRQTPAGSGFFLVLEGGDGAGKTTQVDALADWIRAKGHEVVVTKEPGSTPVGKRLRSILLDISSAGLSHRAEALLYAADRAEHVDTVVRPALERGAVVISDRYVDSSVAYQGAGRDLSPAEIARINRWATDGLVPHLTVLLDVAPERPPASASRRRRTGWSPSRSSSTSGSGPVSSPSRPPTRPAIWSSTPGRSPRTSPPPSGTGSTRCCRSPRPRRRPRKRHASGPRKKRGGAPRRRPAARRRRSARSASARSSWRSSAARRRSASAAKRNWRASARRPAGRRRPGSRPRRPAGSPRRNASGARPSSGPTRRSRSGCAKRAEEEKRLRAEAEERRLERQRKAEEALLKAEQARAAAAAEAKAKAEADAEAEAAERARREEADAQSAQSAEAPGDDSPAGGSASGNSGAEDRAPDGAEADTAQIPQVGSRDESAGPDAEDTTQLPRPGSGPSDDETTVLPRVADAPGGQNGEGADSDATTGAAPGPRVPGRGRDGRPPAGGPPGAVRGRGFRLRFRFRLRFGRCRGPYPGAAPGRRGGAPPPLLGGGHPHGRRPHAGGRTAGPARLAGRRGPPPSLTADGTSTEGVTADAGRLADGPWPVGPSAGR